MNKDAITLIYMFHNISLRPILLGSLIILFISPFIVSANDADGVFGDYFRNMIGQCNSLDGSVVTGFSTTKDSSYGGIRCLSIKDIIVKVFAGQTAPAGKAVVGFDPNGNLQYDTIFSIWTQNGTSTYYNNGNVGIGISSPSAKLDVNGNIQSAGSPIPPNWYNIQGGSIGASTIYGYGNVCSQNSSGDCRGGGGVVMGSANPNANISLSADGNAVIKGSISGAYGLIPSYRNWGAFGLGDGGAALYNDSGNYKKLMIVGNNSGGGSREVGIWDNLTVAGNVTASNFIGNASTANTASTVTNLSGIWDGLNYFRSNKGAGSYIGSQYNYPLQAYSSDGGAAGMSFHRGGYYAVNLGLDPDNVFRLGGWSAGSARWQVDMAGNETVPGSITTNEAYNNGWYRSNGQTGWYNQTYGIGLYAADTQWIRTYGNASIWANGGTLGTNGSLSVGYGGTAGPGGGAIVAGNVGIGTSSPGTNLDVNGNTRITGSIGVGSAGPENGGWGMSIHKDDWAIVTRRADGGDNTEPQNPRGSLYVNDIYLRSVGKWASQVAQPPQTTSKTTVIFDQWYGPGLNSGNQWYRAINVLPINPVDFSSLDAAQSCMYSVNADGWAIDYYPIRYNVDCAITQTWRYANVSIGGLFANINCTTDAAIGIDAVHVRAIRTCP